VFLEEKLATNEEKSFLKRLFNWKYLIILIILQALLVYLTIELSKMGHSGLGLLMLAVMYFLSRRLATNSEKVLSSSLQWASITLYAVITGLIYTAFISYTMNQSSLSSPLARTIDVVLKANANLPKQVSEELKMTRMSKINEHTVVMDMQYISYTKDEVLSAFTDTYGSGYKDQVEKDELQGTCPGASNSLRLGLLLIVAYFGKDNQSIIQIELNDKKCKSYYTKSSK
jgi:hypothetical protein